MEKFKILVVESDEQEFKKLNNFLNRHYGVLRASSYLSAVEILRNQEDVINAVILNLAIKDRSGYKILEFMNNSMLSSRIPVVVLSKDIDRSGANRCYSLGTAFIVTAPFYSYKVLNVIKNSINLFRLNRSNEVNGNSFVLEYYCANNLFAFLKSDNKEIDYFKLYSPEALNKLIFEDDRANFSNSLNNAKKIGEYFSSIRLKSDNDKGHWYDVYFKKSSELSVKETIIISFSDAQEIHEKEMFAKKKAQMLNIISDVIANYFIGTFVVNLNTKSTTILSPDNDLTLGNKGKQLSFTEMLENYCENFVNSQYKESFRTCTDFVGIMKKLENRSVIDTIYQKKDNSWFSVKIYKTIDYSLENPVTLWIFENATDKYKQFLIQKELSQKVKLSEMENERLMMLAHTDSLTGMFNETTFREIVCERIDDGKTGLFMMIDGDGFKSINDTYGHSVGDEVIKGVATAILARTRDYDVCSRLHGDEFAIWVEDTLDEEIALRITDDINKIIAHISEKRSIPSVTVSSGFTVMKLGDDYKSLYVRADKELYKAKSARTNTVLT